MVTRIYAICHCCFVVVVVCVVFIVNKPSTGPFYDNFNLDRPEIGKWLYELLVDRKGLIANPSIPSFTDDPVR